MGKKTTCFCKDEKKAAQAFLRLHCLFIKRLFLRILYAI